MKKLIFSGLAVLASVGALMAGRNMYSRALVNEPALAYNNVYVLDTGGVGSTIDQLSFTAQIATASVASLNVGDGSASTATITISSNPAMGGTQGTNTLSVASTTALSGHKFTLNGIDFANGDLWTAVAQASNTAISIAGAINGYGGTNTTFLASTGPVSASSVTITCVASGTFCNSFTLTTSTTAALTAGGATFSGGRDPARISIAGIFLTANTDFAVGTTSAATANNLSDAIAANASLAAIVKSTWNASAVIGATSTALGGNVGYTMTSSTPAALAISSNVFLNGSASNFNTGANLIKVTNHGLTTGLQVLFSTVTGSTPPANLVSGVTYYAIMVDANNFQLATTLAKATSTINTPISVSTQIVTGGDKYTFTPSPYTGTPSFKWEVSNDGANWFNANASSVTYNVTTSSSAVWDFQFATYRFYRLNVVAPTAGGLNLVVTGNGKSVGQ